MELTARLLQGLTLSLFASVDTFAASIDTPKFTVSGPGFPITFGDGVDIGRATYGGLYILNGARIVSNTSAVSSGRLGVNSDAEGVVEIAGAGSLWNSTATTEIGVAGKGTLTLRDQGTFKTQKLIIATDDGSVGEVNIGAAPNNSTASAGNIEATEGIWFGAGTGDVNFNHTTSGYVFSTPIYGTGTVNVLAGETLLSGKNLYSGNTLIKNGTLAATTENTLSPNSDYQVLPNGTLALNGYHQTLASLVNAGTVSLQGTVAGTLLTVSGDYTGHGGLILFNAELHGDESLTDRLIIKGNTAGSTRVKVDNLGGTGADTLNGIEVITVQGNSAGEFIQEGRIVAGAYDYRLLRATSGDWFITTDKAPVDPETPVGPEKPVTSEPSGQTLRPEGGSYTSNLAAANTMFTTSLNDRQGETGYTDAITGEKKITSMWMHVSGGHNRFHDSSGQLSTQANRYVTLLGGDVAAGTGKNGSAWRLGALAGYGNSRSNTNSNLTGYRAKGEVDGYTTGVYVTWYAQGSDEKGLYIDSVLQYSWFDNTVRGEDIASESYDSKGFTASVESGYVFALRDTFFLQPKAQLAWSGIRADDHTESNGTQISGTGNGNLRSTVGVKAFTKGNSSVDEGKQRTFKPFVEANWIHNSESYGVRMDDVNVSQAGSRNIVELKMGVEGHITSQLNLTGSVGQQIGDKSGSDTAGMIGVKYSF